MGCKTVKSNVKMEHLIVGFAFLRSKSKFIKDKRGNPSILILYSMAIRKPIGPEVENRYSKEVTEVTEFKPHAHFTK